MNVPGVPGMAVSAAAHVLGSRQEQPPEISAPDFEYAQTDCNGASLQLQPVTGGDFAAQAYAEGQRHARNRTAIKCGSVLLVGGGIAAAVLYGCSSPADRTPGGHSVAVVESPNEVLKNVTFTSDTRIAFLQDAEGSTKATGVDYSCPPWPLNLVACGLTSVHTAKVSVTEDIELLAKKGALTLDGEMGPDNKPVVTVHVDSGMLEANPQGAAAVVDDSTYGAQWIKNRFGTTNETLQFKAVSGRYVQDRLTDECALSVENEGNAVAVAIADAVRQKILDVAPALHTADPQGEKLLDEMGSSTAVYKIDADGKPLRLQTNDTYKEGQKLKIAGMDVSFAPSKECNLGPAASQYLVQNANDPTVQVISGGSN